MEIRNRKGWMHSLPVLVVMLIGMLENLQSLLAVDYVYFSAPKVVFWQAFARDRLGYCLFTRESGDVKKLLFAPSQPSYKITKEKKVLAKGRTISVNIVIVSFWSG
jgi:hypothetical protein